MSGKEENNLPLPSASLNILRKQCESRQMIGASPVARPSAISISVVDLVKMGRETMSKCISENSDHFSFHNASVLPFEQSKDLELVINLQTAAYSFSRQQFDQARYLLSFCQRSASHNGDPLQRLLHYFAEALQEGIIAEMGEVILQEPHKGSQKSLAYEELFTQLQTAMFECNETLPFCQVLHFTAIQAILDNLASARRIHVVDLGIKSGSQWPILMQALLNRKECPLEYLKITAVGSSEGRIEETGKKLSSFAESLNIPFSFKIVLSDLKNLEKDFFDLADDEVLAVYSELRLATLLGWPHHLESTLETIKKLKPQVIVTAEVDSNTNAPLFLDRFNASLSISAAMFDCLEVCTDRESNSREIIESVFLRQSINYLVTSKGEESIHRQETAGFWRALFEKFGMAELELSNCALYQASLVVKRNPRWSSCTLERNGKGIIVGWKGTPVHFLSVWKC